jgi:actin-like ATPase involved in cell morphogenesis/sugar lactone lactonase YvrE
VAGHYHPPGGGQTINEAPVSYSLGVDIGTTFSAAAVYRQGRAEMVSLGYRSALVPSAVLITSTNETLVGDAALRRGQSEPERLARFFKRRIGDSVPMILGGSPLSSEALTARLLRAVADQVIEQQGEQPASIAVTRPANWGPFKQDRFDQALRLADLQDVIVLTEPEAAALAYAAEQRIAPGAVVAVYDLGGGTFDATVLRREGDRFAVVGEPEGIERLGGIDFDAAVFEHVRQSLYGAVEALDSDDPATLRSISRLRNECIDAKEALSSDTQVTIPVVLPGLNTEVRLTRAELETMIRPALDDSIAALRRAIASAGVEAGGIDRVLLVGGSSRIPLVAQVVTSAFGRPVALDAHPKHAVALGAALVAGGEGVEGRAIGATATTPIVPTPTAAGSPSPAVEAPASGVAAPAGGATSTAGTGLAAAGLAGAALAGAGSGGPGAPAGAEPGTEAAFAAGPGAPAEANPADQPFAFTPGPPAGADGPHEAPLVSDGSLPGSAGAGTASPPSPPPDAPAGAPSGDAWPVPNVAPGPAGPTSASGDRWAPPAGPDAPTRIQSGDDWVPAASASGPGAGPAGGPSSGDRWAPPAGPDAPTRVDSGDAWAPPPAGAGLDDTKVQGDDTLEAPAASPSGPPETGRPPSGDDWAPPPGGRGAPAGRRVATGLAAGAAVGAAGLGVEAAGASPGYAGPAGAPAPTWTGPGAGSYPPGGGPPARGPDGRGGRKWLVPAVAAAAVIALGAGGVWALAGGGDDDTDGGSSSSSVQTTSDTTGPGSTSGTTAPPTMPGTLTDGKVIDLPHGGDGVALDGSGRLWVATNRGGDALMRYDTPNDGDGGGVSIPVASIGDDPLAVWYDFDSIWVTLRNSDIVLRIDPDAASEADDGVQEQYETPGAPVQVVSGAGYMWVVSQNPEGETNGRVTRIDPSTGETIEAEVLDPMGVVVDDDSRVWVTHGTNRLAEYDLDLTPQGEEITVGDNADEVAYAGGYIWTANRNAGTVSYVDRDGRTEVGTIDVGGNPAGLRADGDRLWVTDTAEAEGAGDGRLILIDAASQVKQAELPLGPRPLGLTVDGDSVWVSLYAESEAKVIRVDATA